MKKFIFLLAATCLMFLSPVMAQKKVFRDLKVSRSLEILPEVADSGKVLMAVDAQGNSIWQSVAAIGPCCLPDTPSLSTITVVNCTTGTRPAILTYNPQNSQVSNTNCDTLQYLYIDTLQAGYFNSSGNPNEVLYYDSNGYVTSDSNFVKTEAKSYLTNGNYTLFTGGMPSYLPSLIPQGTGMFYNSPNILAGHFLENQIDNFRVASGILNVSNNNYLSIAIDTFKINLSFKSVFGDPENQAAITISAIDSSINFNFGIENYSFPKTSGPDGYTLGFVSVNQLGWINTPAITSGSGAPATTPAKIGDLYIDISNRKLYFAVGTTNSGDWEITN